MCIAMVERDYCNAIEQDIAKIEQCIKEMKRDISNDYLIRKNCITIRDEADDVLHVLSQKELEERY